MLKNIKRNLLAMLFVLASIFIVSGEIYGAGEDRVYEANSGKRMGTIDVEYSYYEDESERHKITGRNNAEIFHVQNPINIKDSAKALAYLKPDGKTVVIEIIDLVVESEAFGDRLMDTVYKEHTYQSGGQKNFSIGGLGPDSGDLLIRVSGMPRGQVPAPKPEKPSGNWRKNNTGWWYQFSNGTYPKNRWEKINNKWYYFNSKGYIETGWTKVKGTWYYLNPSGAMQTGWTKVKNKWYYLNSSGAMQTGWTKVKNKWYHMNASGAMQTGWTKVKNKWYYMNASGAMQTGWTKVRNKWYYLNSSGAMQIGWTKVKNKWYYMNANGAMQTGWTKVRNKWYYLNSSGAMQTDWKKVKNRWYYMNTSGAMQTGWTKVKNKWYYLNSSGAMQTGWTKVKNKWYYLNSSGAMQTGWKKINNKWYYMYSSGAMASNTMINGHFVGENGVWVKTDDTSSHPTDYDELDDYVMDNKLFNEEMLNLINAARSKQGVHGLKYSSVLQKGTDVRTDEITSEHSLDGGNGPHTRPDGSEWHTAFDYIDINKDGITVSGENLAQNFTQGGEELDLVFSGKLSPEKYMAGIFFEQYYRSQGHYENMISESHDYVSVAIQLSNSNTSAFNYYFNTMIFGADANW